MSLSYYLKLLSGPLCALLITLFLDLAPGQPAVTAMAGIAVWMAIWWLTEVVHLAVTSLIPFILIPILGIADAKAVASQYMDPIIFLFIGGFIIAFAIERWGLHKRIALKILSIVGSKPSRILLGVMLTSFLVSMWISNTATVMMLISAVLAVVLEVEKYSPEHSKKIAAALLIGLAYSASIGGMATLVGTPTNMIFASAYNEAFPANGDLNFTSWFVVAFPVAFIFMLVAFFTLRWMFLRGNLPASVDRTFFRNSYKALGKMSYEERIVGIIFCLTALLWFTREDIDFGSVRMPGWNNHFGAKKYITDGTVAVLMAFLLFLIPSKNEKGNTLISWSDAGRLPFDIILLFGSGFALAKGFEVSGLSTWLATKLAFLNKSNLPLIILGICMIVAIISEFASNVASIQLVIPILLSLQKVLDVHPLVLLIPATLAASLGFMLPVATAPNTIVFSSRRIRVKDMMKAGLILDVAGVILITIAAIFFIS